MVEERTISPSCKYSGVHTYHLPKSYYGVWMPPKTNLVKPYATPGIGTKPEWSNRIHILKPLWRHGLRQSDRSTNNGLKY